MITHFGNEIKLSSDRLSYSLFESDWMEQSNSCQKCIVILAEIVKQPHELVIWKLYPLNLKTFTSVSCILICVDFYRVTDLLLQILNLAYSMFNILRNV